MDVLLGDVTWETSYGLPGEGSPPRVRADITLDWPTWAQSAYRSWYIDEPFNDPPRIEIEIVLRIQRLAGRPQPERVLEVLPETSPAIGPEVLDRSSPTIEEVFAGRFVPARGILPPGTLGFNPALQGYPYDPERARALLAEAGYPNGFDAVLRVAPQYYYTVRTGEIIVNQLQKVGIRVRIEQIEWGQWLARVYREADYDLTIIGHAESWDIGNYANPKYYFRYDSPRFQELFQKSEVTLDDPARRELYVEMQKLLAEEAPVVWLFVHPRLVAMKKGVTGFWKALPTPSVDLSEVGCAQ